MCVLSIPASAILSICRSSFWSVVDTLTYPYVATMITSSCFRNKKPAEIVPLRLIVYNKKRPTPFGTGLCLFTSFSLQFAPLDELETAPFLMFFCIPAYLSAYLRFLRGSFGSRNGSENGMAESCFFQYLRAFQRFRRFVRVPGFWA